MLTAEELKRHALQIWQAGVEAVTPARLFADKLELRGSWLSLDEFAVDLSRIRRLIVVGAGKASAAMAVALHQTVLARLPKSVSDLPVSGWINAPAESFTAQQALSVAPITLHAARPAGLNWPTPEAVYGTEQILGLVRNATRDDLVLCLWSGGGSALLVAPRAGVSLADKQAVARLVAAAGGNIDQLNTVRRALSQVKGGGLARACGAGQLLSLIISDVIGDPLETIASGPTWLAASSNPQAAWQVLSELGVLQAHELAGVVRFLEQELTQSNEDRLAPSNFCGNRSPVQLGSGNRVTHVVLGNNADAIDAAGVKAVELGYRYVMQGARAAEGDVRQVAEWTAAAIEQLTHQHEIDCWISGGEPTVVLPSQGGGKGGRNQQLALAILQKWQATGGAPGIRPVVFVSGGTDGEDGPTDAAGACIDQSTCQRVSALGLASGDFLERADAYTFFERVGGLLRTGPTGTNVCDLRVALAAPQAKV